MKTYTTHIRANRPPVLIKEGFSVAAFLFGGLWLLAHRAWLPGILALAAGTIIDFLTSGPARVTLEIGLAALLGLFGRDLYRWSLTLRGYVTAHVIAAQDRDAALLRLLSIRPELGPRFAPAEELQ